jgi:hypothetical protein
VERVEIGAEGAEGENEAMNLSFSDTKRPCRVSDRCRRGGRRRRTSVRSM